jgi:hypothetical protein
MPSELNWVMSKWSVKTIMCQDEFWSGRYEILAFPVSHRRAVNGSFPVVTCRNNLPSSLASFRNPTDGNSNLRLLSSISVSFVKLVFFFIRSGRL